MPVERRHESADLTDYEVLDSSDTLAGAPGDDPLDRGIATPERWSAAMKFGSTAAEQISGESLERRLAEEDPDESADAAADQPDGVSADENATDSDIAGSLDADRPGRRTGRLVRAYDDDAVFLAWETDAVARDVGIDGGGATAEEAALHIVADADTTS